MPGGLPEIVQPVGADTSRYVSEYRAALAVTKELLAAQQELARIQGFPGTGGTSGAAAAAADVAKVNAAIREQMGLLNQARTAVGDFGTTAAAAHSAVAGQVDALGSSYEAMRGRISDMAAEALRMNSQMADAAMQQITLNQRAVSGYEATRQSVRGATVDIVALKEEAAAAGARVTEAAAAVVAARQAASSGGGGSDLGAALAAAAASGGGMWNSTTDAATAAIIARNIARTGGTASNTGNAAVTAALAAISGGGGGGGGLGGFFTGGGRAGEFDPKTAAGAFANVASFVGRWYPAAHWMVMLGNELLATAGPAAIALGSAGLVGLQGGQQLVNRYQAVSSVAEAFGPTTGQSTATMLGLPNTLQQLQNQYGSGEMYGIAGAGINALRTGGGSAFLQLGQNTLSMISGAAADFVLAMKGGLGQAAGAIVQGGTGYAQQFGDVLGNVGKIFMNVAPNLPGVGSMLLTTLQSATGGIADVTKALGPGLLPLLGFEAGARWGPTIVGGAAAGLQALPFGIGGSVATVAHAATAEEAAASGGKLAIGDLVGAEKGAGLAGLLGGLTAPEIGGIAAATIAVVRGLTAKTAAQQQYAGLASSLTGANLVGNLSQIATAAGAIPGGGLAGAAPGRWWQASGAGTGAFGNLGVLGGAFPDLGKAAGDQMKQGVLGIGDLFTGQWSKALHSVGNMWQDLVGSGGIIHGLGQMLGIVGPPPSPAEAAMQQLGKAFGTWSNMLGAPSQVKDIWKEMGSGALSTAQSLDVLAQSGVNINTAFQKNGELTAKASQQVKDYVAGYQAMTGTVPGGATGGTLAAINAVGVAGGLSASKLSTVNSALDQIVQIASGGGAGTAALTALLAAVPATKGAVSPLTAAGAAQMTAFAGTAQPSVLSQLEQQADWMRTAQVLGAFGTGGTTQAGMAKYLIAQALKAPGVAQTPMEMAQLSTVAQQYGMAPIAPGETAKQMDASFQTFLKGADSAKQYAQQLTTTTEKVSSIPADYQQFVTTAAGGAQQGLANAVNLFGQQVQTQFMGAFAGGKTAGAPLEKQYANILAAAGFKPGAAGDVAGYAAKMGGATPGQIQSVVQGIIKYTAQIETPKPPSVEGKPIHYGTHVDPAVAKAPPSPPPIHYGTRTDTPVPKPAPQGAPIHYPVTVQTPVAPPAPAGGTVYYHSVVIGPGGAGISTVGPGGTTAYAMRAAQSGFRVPGFGGGDIVPAMLEPGEVVVPKTMVSAGAVDHLRGSIPGFAAGGLAGVDVPFVTGVGTMFRIAMQDTVNDLITALNGVLGQVTSGIRPAGSPPGMMQPYGGSGSGGGKPVVLQGGAVPVHVASVAPHLEGGGGSGTAVALGGGGLPLTPPAANKVFDKFEETFKKLGSPWGKLASDILTQLREGITNGKHETAKMAQALVSQVSTEITSMKGMGTPWAGLAAQIMNGMLDGIKGNKGETAAMAQAMFAQVTKEVNYMKTVAGASNAISQWGTFGTGLATPTTTAQGKNYQYYTDQQTIAGGGTVSVQQNMSDYLQAMQSFQGDIGKLSKAGINKQMLQQIIGAGPLQGDQEAQSILGGQGGVAAANKLWGQINATSKQLGITAGQDVYGYGGVGGKNVKVGASVTGGAAVHSLQSAINALKDKTITIKVDVEMGSGGGGRMTPLSDLSKADLASLTSQIQAQLLKQAKSNRRTGLQLSGYGA